MLYKLLHGIKLDIKKIKTIVDENGNELDPGTIEVPLTDNNNRRRN